jgi:hypothetical protein
VFELQKGEEGPVVMTRAEKNIRLSAPTLELLGIG